VIFTTPDAAIGCSRQGKRERRSRNMWSYRSEDWKSVGSREHAAPRVRTVTIPAPHGSSEEKLARSNRWARSVASDDRTTPGPSPTVSSSVDRYDGGNDSSEPAPPPKWVGRVFAIVYRRATGRSRTVGLAELRVTRYQWQFNRRRIHRTGRRRICHRKVGISGLDELSLSQVADGGTWVRVSSAGARGHTRNVCLRTASDVIACRPGRLIRT